MGLSLDGSGLDYGIGAGWAKTKSNSAAAPVITPTPLP
jgi:hypothetical protein